MLLKRVLAALSLCVLTACTTNASPPTTPPTTPPADDCDSQPCISATLKALSCALAGRRQFKLAITNDRSKTARYRLDYYVPEITLLQDDGLGHFTIDGGQKREHTFVSAIFDKRLTVTVTQLDQTGQFVVHETTPEIVLERC